MTSSLVGSEMCIRDSNSVKEAEDAAYATTNAASAATSAAIPPKEGPVSYTHLTLPTICSV
eukprot:3688571-Prorocentrum_lima.AAC.1